MKRFPPAASLCLLFFLNVNFAFGYRSGFGRSSRNSGLELYEIILVVIVVSAGAYVVRRYLTWSALKKKKQETDELLQYLQGQDPTWNPAFMTARVREVFEKVQQSITERNPDLVSDFMSPYLFQKHQGAIKHQVLLRKKIIIEDIALDEVQILRVADYQNDTLDSFKVYLSGSKVIHEMDESQPADPDGKPSPDSFQEIWHFIKQNDTWVADRIDTEVAYDDIEFS